MIGLSVSRGSRSSMAGLVSQPRCCLGWGPCFLQDTLGWLQLVKLLHWEFRSSWRWLAFSSERSSRKGSGRSLVEDAKLTWASCFGQTLKCIPGKVVLGGWMIGKQAMPLEPPWFSIEITPREGPWLSRDRTMNHLGRVHQLSCSVLWWCWRYLMLEPSSNTWKLRISLDVAVELTTRPPARSPTDDWALSFHSWLSLWSIWELVRRLDWGVISIEATRYKHWRWRMVVSRLSMLWDEWSLTRMSWNCPTFRAWWTSPKPSQREELQKGSNAFPWRNFRNQIGAESTCFVGDVSYCFSCGYVCTFTCIRSNKSMRGFKSDAAWHPSNLRKSGASFLSCRCVASCLVISLHLAFRCTCQLYTV